LPAAVTRSCSAADITALQEIGQDCIVQKPLSDDDPQRKATRSLGQEFVSESPTAPRRALD
jgi:hypothetical protein